VVNLHKVRDEVERLCKTIWEPSKSPIASPGSKGNATVRAVGGSHQGEICGFNEAVDLRP
jgi:hypothetical protein